MPKFYLSDNKNDESARISSTTTIYSTRVNSAKKLHKKPTVFGDLFADAHKVNEIKQ